MIRIVGIEPGARKAQQYFFFGPNARARAAQAWSTAPKDGGKALREAFSPKADVRIIEAEERIIEAEEREEVLSAVSIEAPAAVAPLTIRCPSGHLVARGRCTVCTWEVSR